MVRLSLIMLFVSSFSVNSTTLTSAYKDYQNDLTFNNVKKNYRQFFSGVLVGGIDINNDFLVEQLMFKDNMKNVVKLNEVLYSDYGCLTVNGLGLDKQLMSFNIEYTRESPRALIKAVDILLLDNDEEFSNRAVCPKEYIIE